MITRFRLPTLVTALLSVAIEAPAHADFVTGNRLFQDCQATDFFSQGACMGFVAGVADAMTTAQAANGTVAGWRACLSEQITAGEVRDVAVNFLARHPEKRDIAAATLVAQALEEAFPCPTVTNQG
jgi:hypothetical protein